MLRWQKNTRIMSVASVLVIAAGFLFQINALEMALLIVVISIVWLTEFLNAGIEAAVDLASPDLHPMAKVGKDVAAAAVLLGVITSIIVGLLVLGPYVLARLS